MVLHHFCLFTSVNIFRNECEVSPRFTSKAQYSTCFASGLVPHHPVDHWRTWRVESCSFRRLAFPGLQCWKGFKDLTFLCTVPRSRWKVRYLWAFQVCILGVDLYFFGERLGYALDPYTLKRFPIERRFSSSALICYAWNWGGMTGHFALRWPLQKWSGKIAHRLGTSKTMTAKTFLRRVTAGSAILALW